MSLLPSSFKRLPLLGLAMLATLSSHASENPGAHSHGVAKLQVALEPPRIDLMLVSPAANLVGFEHQPQTDAQKQDIRSVREWLGSNPLVSSGDGCRLVESEVMDGFGVAGHHQGGEDHHPGHRGHHDYDHNEHHKKHHGENYKKHHKEHHKGHHRDGDHHDGHHEGHHGGEASGEHHGKHNGKHHGHEDETQHREFTVSQQLACKGDMNTLTTGLMERFPGIEQLQVEWLGAGDQGSVRLGAGDREFSVSR